MKVEELFLDITIVNNYWIKDPYFSADYNKFNIDYQLELKLNEAISKSFSQNDLIARLKGHHHLEVLLDKRIPENVLVEIPQRIPLNQTLSDILRTIDQFGWFISNVEVELENGKTEYFKTLSDIKNREHYKLLCLILEPLHSRTVPIPEFLYHATPLAIWEDKVSKVGLAPKSKMQLGVHPARIYVAASVEAVESLIEAMSVKKQEISKTTTYFDASKFYKSWAILKIDTSEIPMVGKYTYFKLHVDTKASNIYNSALYTVNYIPPKALSLLKKVEL